MEMKESLSFCQWCLWTLFYEASKRAFCVRGQQAGLYPSATQGTQFLQMGTQDLLPGGRSWIATMVPWQPWWWSTIHSSSVPLNWHQNGNTGERQSSTALWGGVGSGVLAELSENTTWNSCYLCSPHVCQLPVSLASLLGDGNLVLRVSLIHVTLDLLFLSRAEENDTVKGSKHVEDALTFSLLTLCFCKSLPV